MNTLVDWVRARPLEMNPAPHAGTGPRRAVPLREHLRGKPSPVAPIESMAFSLDARGTILDCDETSDHLFGYPRHALRGQPISMILPDFAEVDLLVDGRLNTRLHFMCHIGSPFTARRRDGAQFLFQVFLNQIGSAREPNIRMIVRRC